MTSLIYLAQSVPWAVAGLVVGYLMGRSARNLDVLAESVSPEEPMPEPKPKPRWWKRITGQHMLGVVVFVLAVATVVQGYVSSEQTRRIADCTKGYSNGFADAIDARSAASTSAQNALDQWMSTLGELVTRAPTNSADAQSARERFQQATAEYLNKRAEAKTEQSEHPYPPPPRDLCK